MDRAPTNRPLSEIHAALSPLQALMTAITTGPGRDLHTLNYTLRGIQAQFTHEGKLYEMDLRELGPVEERSA